MKVNIFGSTGIIGTKSLHLIDRKHKLIKNVMENAHKPVLNLSVPLIVDANFGKNWDEAH